MNIVQQKLLELAASVNLAKMPLREIAIKIGAASPQVAQYHIDQLSRKGLLWIDRRAGKMKLIGSESSGSTIRIPILGAADCGPARQIAQEIEPIEYITMSPSLLDLKVGDNYFGLIAVGDSMNAAKVKTFGGLKASINSGDIVVVKRVNAVDPNRGPYIVAIIDGLANIKKLVVKNDYAELVSESTRKYSPIFLEPDLENFISGEVVGVIKR